jgi:LysM repeat protein
MKYLHKLLFISLIVSFSISIGFTNAQDNDNLLTNGGFEGNFTTYDGEQPRQVADSWIPWHVPATDDMPSFQNAAPKYQPVSPDSSRIRTGSNAQLYFSFFETHEGGIYQQVDNVTDGTEYRFSIYAHVWSSTFEDVDVSEDPGDVALRVGIDPTGGTDGTSSDIVWSTPAIFYDTYRQYSIITTAESDTITVFVESTVGSPVQNSYVYLDDAVLASTSKPAEPTDVPTDKPTDVPTEKPTDKPTNVPTDEPTESGAGIGDSTPTLEVLEPTNTPLPTATHVPPTPTRETNIVPTATEIQPQGGSGGNDDRPISDTFPGTIIHTVRRGDIVSRIATLYGSSTEAIIAANALNDSALIFVGQGLVVPVRIPDPATVTPTSTNVVIVVTATQAAAPIPTPNDTYIVQPGDTLNQIAARFNTTVGALVQLNGIANPNRIFFGQVLRIPVAGGSTIVPTAPQPNIIPTPTPLPPQQTYTVIPGDTLFSLALRFGVNIVDLAEENNITNYNRIFIGQILRLPR